MHGIVVSAEVVVCAVDCVVGVDLFVEFVANVDDTVDWAVDVDEVVEFVVDVAGVVVVMDVDWVVCAVVGAAVVGFDVLDDVELVDADCEVDVPTALMLLVLLRVS